MKRPLAAVALVVLTWSNATALQCAAAAAAPGPESAAQAHRHGGHDHGAPSPAPGSGADALDHGDDASQGGRADCGVLMSCGAGLVAHVPQNDARPVDLERMEVPVLATPSAADLTRDPPPPRRSA